MYDVCAKQLKIFDVDLLNDQAGITRISFVNNPAFGVHFSYFNDIESGEGLPVFLDEEKREVFGPVIIPDKLILRNDPIATGEELYYIRFSAETIRKYVEKYFNDKNIDQFNAEHTFGLDGLTLIESLIKDSARGINPVGFEDLPDGTWFLGFKVNNDILWQDIKAGEFNGFSQEIGYALIDSGEQITTNFNNMKKKWSVFSAFRKIYKDAVGQQPTYSRFGSVSTDKGELSYDGELIDGKEGVSITTENGETALADGRFTLQTTDDRNGRVVEIENGVVQSISLPDGSPTEENFDTGGEETTAEAPLEVQIAEIKQHAEALEGLQEYVAEHIDEVVDQITEVLDRVESEFTAIKVNNTLKEYLESKFAGIEKRFVDMEVMMKSPAGTPTPTASGFASADISPEVRGFWNNNK